MRGETNTTTVLLRLGAKNGGDVDRRLVQIVALIGLVAGGPAMRAHADPYGEPAAPFTRRESAFERVDGYFNALGRDLRRGLDLAIGPELPIDARLGAWDP